MIDNHLVRILLMPFSLIYGGVIAIRNAFYDVEILKASRFSIPIISVGNLSIGGAGKTPHVEYLVQVLRPYLNLGILSRGYNRKTKGYLKVQAQDYASRVGDEPAMYARMYNDVFVAVCESRSTGIPEMVKQDPRLQTIILDDAFQHRSVVPDINILLTQCELPFTKDFLLPAGRLRENRSSYERADVIIVTKCNPEFNEIDRNKLLAEIAPLDYQSVFFTKYNYHKPYSFYNTDFKVDLSFFDHILIISAIANTKYMMNYLSGFKARISPMEYEDHRNFSIDDVRYMHETYEKIPEKEKIFLTTAKDAMRLAEHFDFFKSNNIPVFILPISVEFLFEQKEVFDSLVRNLLLDFEN